MQLKVAKIHILASPYMFVCPYVTTLKWRNRVSWNLIAVNCTKIFNTFQFQLKSDDDNGHFTWRSTYFYMHKWLGRESSGYLGYHGCLGNQRNPKPAAQPCGRILHDDITQPYRCQTPHPCKCHWPQTTLVSCAIRESLR
jgi:hypothetical protein